MRDGPTGVGERYSLVQDNVQSGVSVPVSSRLVLAIEESAFLHIVRSADFDVSLS